MSFSDFVPHIGPSNFPYVRIYTVTELSFFCCMMNHVQLSMQICWANIDVQCCDILSMYNSAEQTGRHVCLFTYGEFANNNTIDKIISMKSHTFLWVKIVFDLSDKLRTLHHPVCHFAATRTARRDTEEILVFPSLHERCKFCVGQLCLFLVSWGRGFSYRDERSLVNFLNVHRSYYSSLSRCSHLLSLAVKSYILMHLDIKIAVSVAKVLFKVYFQFQGTRIQKITAGSYGLGSVCWKRPHFWRITRQDKSTRKAWAVWKDF